MTNASILQRNTLAGLSDEAGSLYMRGAGRDERAAFRCACEWDDVLGPTVEKMVPLAAVRIAHLGDPERVSRELLEFLRERHFRRYFPGNKDRINP